MNRIQTIQDITVTNKTVLVRVDFNVPLDSQGSITDDTRIIASLPTIEYLLKNQAKVILTSHLGRPDGKVNPKYSLSIVAQHLAKKLNHPVLFVQECTGERVNTVVKQMQQGTVILLENTRFHPEEENNDPLFSKQLSTNIDIYVNDAFGTAHRAHASTVGVSEYIPIKVAGFLMKKELEYLGTITTKPQRPFTVIIGGSKITDKIQVINALLDKADIMIIGGAMAYTFCAALGYSVGKSLVELDAIPIALQAIQKAKNNNVQLLLPTDHIVTDSLDFSKKTLGTTQTVSENIPDDTIGIDIGPKTIEVFKKSIQKSSTIFWNGPMGIFEIDLAAKGTFAIAQAIANSQATSIIGGGDSIKAIQLSGYSNKITFISTGGGASLEYLEGKILPGVSILNTIDT